VIIYERWLPSFLKKTSSVLSILIASRANISSLFHPIHSQCIILSGTKTLAQLGKGRQQQFPGTLTGGGGPALNIKQAWCIFRRPHHHSHRVQQRQHIRPLRDSSTADQYQPRLRLTHTLTFVAACRYPATARVPVTHRPNTVPAHLSQPGLVIRRDSAPPKTTTPPSALKRKASDLGNLGPPDGPRKKQTPEISVPSALPALPATPVTTTSANMDSDDDFNSSQMSDEEFMGDQDSDISLGDGKHGSSRSVYCVH
jgi:hypothetical protein